MSNQWRTAWEELKIILNLIDTIDKVNQTKLLTKKTPYLFRFVFLMCFKVFAIWYYKVYRQ